MVSLINWANTHTMKSASISGIFLQATLAISGIIFAPALIKYLGEANAGLWLSLVGLISLVGVFDFGFSTCVTREVAYSYNYKNKIDRMPHNFVSTKRGLDGAAQIFLASRRFFLLVSLVSFVVFIFSFELLTVFSLDFGYEKLRLVCYIVFLSFLLNLLTKPYQALLDGMGYMYLSRIILGCYQVLVTCFLLIVLVNRFEFMALALVLVITSACQLLAFHLIVKKLISVEFIGSQTFDKKLFKSLLKVSIPFGWINLSAYLVGTAQIPLLAYILGLKIVAPIYIAYRFSQGLNSIIFQITSAGSNLLTKYIAIGDFNLAKIKMIRLIFLALILESLASFFLYYLSPSLSKNLLGVNNYIDENVLLIFSLVHFILGTWSCVSQLVTSSGRNPFALSSIVHGLVALLAMLVLCPVLGLIGVPLASLLGFSLIGLWLIPIEAFKLYKHLQV